MKDFNTIGNFILLILEKFKADVYVKASIAMLLGALGLLGGTFFTFGKGEYYFVYENTSSLLTNGVAIFLISFASWIIYKRLNVDLKKKHFLFFVSDKGFNTEDKLPEDFIPKKDRYGLLPYEKKIDTYNKLEVMHTYVISKDNITNRTSNKNIDKTYIAGLGGFPHLFLCGSLFGSGYASKVKVMDFNRNTNVWELLKPLGAPSKYKLSSSSESIESKIDDLVKDNFDEVGIAIANTFEIIKESIPDYLQSHTLFIEPEIGQGINIINNKTTQASLLTHITEIMGNLSNKKKKIHLFVCGRSAFCIELGMYYMPRTHSTVVLHNYNNITKDRDWNITLENGELS